MDQFFQARGVDGLSGLQLHVTHVLVRVRICDCCKSYKSDCCCLFDGIVVKHTDPR